MEETPTVPAISTTIGGVLNVWYPDGVDAISILLPLLAYTSPRSTFVFFSNKAKVSSSITSA